MAGRSLEIETLEIGGEEPSYFKYWQRVYLKIPRFLGGEWILEDLDWVMRTGMVNANGDKIYNMQLRKN